LKQRIKIFIIFNISVLLFACTNESKTSRDEQLAGMYKLYNIQVQDSAGEWHDQWASDGTGYILYDGKGHMAVQITPKGYSQFKWLLSEGETNKPGRVKAKIDSMSVDELKAALAEFVSNYVYVGNYSVSDSANIVFHNRLSHTIPSAWNTTVKRRFIFNGDTLELYVDTDKRRLKWIKQK
jgi:Lipocalin-like domain